VQGIVLPSEVGELLLLKRILHAVEGSKEESQREHICHSWCTIQGKICSLIIDEGNSANVVSIHLVDKLELPTVPHPRPYSLQWLEKDNEGHMTRQVLITYTISNIRDEVLCDVLPMDACLILLG